MNITEHSIWSKGVKAMKIKQMFKDDIDRKINGVVQVEQEQEQVVEQEVKEYVVT